VFSFSALVAFPCAIVLSFAKATGLIYAAYWNLQTGGGLFWPSLIVWLTEGFSGKELSREISLYNRSWLSANMLGPLVAGALYKWNSNINFVVLDLCYFTVLILLYMRGRTIKKLGIEEIPVLVRPAISVNAGAEGARGSSLEKTPQDSDVTGKKQDLYLYRGWISMLCTAIFIGIFCNILPLHIRDGMGFSESTAGMVLFVRCAAGLVGFTVLARITVWHYSRRWFIILQGGLVFVSFLFLIAGNTLSLYFMIAVLFGIIHCSGSNNSQFYSGSGKNPKKNLALNEMFICLGNSAGSAGGGILYQHFGLAGTSITLFLVFGLFLGILFIIDRTRQD
jgi:predicted MFS family arabinose efflux permease